MKKSDAYQTKMLAGMTMQIRSAVRDMASSAPKAADTMRVCVSPRDSATASEGREKSSRSAPTPFASTRR